MNSTLLTEARRAADEIEQIRAGARQAAGAVNDIELGNRLQDDLRAAQGELDDLYRQAGEGGGPAGQRGGGNFLSGFSDAVGGLASKTGPIAGSLLGVAALGLTAGALLAGAIKDGMGAELSRDMFQAQTGVTTAQARKYAAAAGEAYANTFGESVAENLDTAKMALQSGLLDPGATQRDAEKMIQSLDGVSRIMGEEIPAVSRAAAQAIKTGFAADAQDAFDLLVKGSQMGMNVSEDLVDTIIEYGTQFRQLGLTGAEAMGLMGQAVKAGARDTDTAADALKEFAIRAIDGSKASQEGYEALGLSASKMSEQIAEGGEGARDGLELVLSKLREIEDPVKRNAAAVALFGTKAEDLGQAMYAMDLTTAVEGLNNYEGAAKRAIDVMNGNAATSVEGAMRAISRASDGLKAALAEAFGPYIQQFADNISNNRAGVIQFFIDVANTAFDAGAQILAFVAEGMRGLGEFAQAGSEMSASFLRGLADMVDGLSMLSDIPGLGLLLPDLGDAGDKLNALADSAENGGQGISDALSKGADAIENNLIPALGVGQERFNEFAGSMQLSAAFNDEIQKVNDSIGSFGETTDGSMFKLQNWTGALDQSIGFQAKMHQTLTDLPAAFEAQARAGLEAGASVEELTAQYQANRGELINQAMQMGLTNQQALELINSYGLVPGLVATQINQPGMPEAQYALDILAGKVIAVPDGKTIHTEALTQDAVDRLQALGLKVETLPDGTVSVTADTYDGQNAIDNFIARNHGRSVDMYVEIQARRRTLGVAPDVAGPVYDPNGGNFADGGVRERANGALDQAHIAAGRGNGTLTTTPLGPVRYAEGETGWEAYIPGAPGKRRRSEKILAETAKRMGFGLLKLDDILHMADGGINETFDARAAVATAMAHDGEGYVYGGLDCSGYPSAVFNAGTGQNVRFTTDSDFEAMGWVPGFDPDGFSIGTNKGSGKNGHMAAYLYGQNIESDATNGIQYGRSADSPLDFPYVYHWPSASAGGNPSKEEIERFGEQQLLEDLNSGKKARAKGATDSGVAMSTDGQRVFVTNWPGSLGGKATDSAEERKPIWSASIRAFDQGGFRDAQIASDGAELVHWAEKGTGGEAYIPLAPGKRGRSLGITREVANRFGFELVPMADGGLTGFGGYVGDKGSTFDVPLTGDGWANMSPNKRRATLASLAGLGVGGAFAIASGFDENGAFTGQFDTGANSHPGLEKAFGDWADRIAEQLEEIRKAAEDPEPVHVQVDIDSGSRTAQIEITKRGL